MPIKNNEEEVQKALGTLPSFRVCIYGPRGGSLIRWAIVEALTPVHAIYAAWTGCSLGVRKHFLKVFQNTFAQSHYGIQRFVFARVERIDSTNPPYKLGDGYKFNNLCQILTFDGELRDDIPEDILENSAK